MTKPNGKAEPFVMLPRDLLASPAWQRCGINTRRLLDFLMIEHMAHAGRGNGYLIAPRRQLEEFGIGARHISQAVEEADALGLSDIKRGIGRRPNTYALTWLPLSDGTPASNRWRVATSEGKSLQMTSEGKSLRYPKGSHKARSDFRREVIKPVSKGIRREVPYKKVSYQGQARGRAGAGVVRTGEYAQPEAGDDVPVIECGEG